MNKIFLPFLLLFSVMLFSYGDVANPLLGRWENKGISKGKPYTFLVIFRDNGQADGFLNGKAFVTTKYFVKGDTLAMSDPTCGADYTGLYKCDFFAPDSLKFHLISDSCRGRVGGTAEYSFFRLKKASK